MDLARDERTRLPEMGPLEAMPGEFWRRLAARLVALGMDETTLRRFDFVGPDLGDALRLPLQQWAARAEATLSTLAVAFLRLQETVSWAELQQVFGGDLAREMRAAGLVVASGPDAFDSSLRLGALNGAWILADRHLFHPDAVMGSSAATSRIFTATAVDSRSWPGEGALLDLGCGGGALALALRPFAKRVVASDISARAIALARINAALNGLAEQQAPAFLVGDLYAPVGEERYARIVCQPPFIPQTGDRAGATFASGGPLGDAITLRVLRGLGPHLAPGGRGVLCVEWAGGTAHPWRERVLEALDGQALQGIHCEMFRTPMEEYCALLAPYLHPPGSPEYGAYLKRMLHYYQQAGIEAIDLVLHFLEPAADGASRHAVRQVPLGSLDHVTAGYADAAFEALRLASAPEPDLRRARLRAPSGFRVLAPDNAESPGDPAGTVEVAFGPEALLPDGLLPAEAASILALAGDGIEANDLLETLAGPPVANLGIMRQLLAQGLLYVG